MGRNFVQSLKNSISFNIVYHLQKNTYNLSKFITTIQRVHVTMGWSHKYMFPVSIFFLLVYFSLLLYFFLLLISLHFPVIVSLPIIAFLFFNCYFPSQYLFLSVISQVLIIIFFSIITFFLFRLVLFSCWSHLSLAYI
jgi:hypothetical protein